MTRWDMQQRLTPRYTEGQQDTLGMMPGTRHHRFSFKGCWIPQAGAVSTASYQQQPKSEPRPQTAGVAVDKSTKQEKESKSQPTPVPAPLQSQPGSLQKSATGPEETGKIHCALCDIQLSESNKTTHEASITHCANYLRKQIILGFKLFDLIYPTAVFGLKGVRNKHPSAKKIGRLQIYRSGLIMKFECSACLLKCLGQVQWYSHICSKKHKKCCKLLISVNGLENFLNTYGVLPVPAAEEEEAKEEGTLTDSGRWWEWRDGGKACTRQTVSAAATKDRPSSLDAVHALPATLRAMPPSTLKDEPLTAQRPVGPVHRAPAMGPIERAPQMGPVDRAPPILPVGCAPPMGPVDCAPPMGPVDCAQPMGPVGLVPPVGPVDHASPMGPVDCAPLMSPPLHAPPMAPIDCAPQMGCASPMSPVDRAPLMGPALRIPPNEFPAKTRRLKRGGCRRNRKAARVDGVPQAESTTVATPQADDTIEAAMDASAVGPAKKLRTEQQLCAKCGVATDNLQQHIVEVHLAGLDFRKEEPKPKKRDKSIPPAPNSGIMATQDESALHGSMAETEVSAVPQAQSSTTETNVSRVSQAQSSMSETNVSRVPQAQISTTETNVSRVPQAQSSTTETIVSRVPPAQSSTSETNVSKVHQAQSCMSETKVNRVPQAQSSTSESNVSRVPQAQSSTSETDVSRMPQAQSSASETNVSKVPQAQSSTSETNVSIVPQAQSSTSETNVSRMPQAQSSVSETKVSRVPQTQSSTTGLNVCREPQAPSFIIASICLQTGDSPVASTVNVAAVGRVEKGGQQQCGKCGMATDDLRQHIVQFHLAAQNVKRTRCTRRPCAICDVVTDTLRQHQLESHLPWYFHAVTACWLCEKPLGNYNAISQHILEHTEEDQRKCQFAPHFTRWSHMMIGLLKWATTLLKTKTFAGLIHLFTQRRWHPDGNAKLGLSMVMLLSEVANVMGLPITPEDIESCPPNHPVALLNWTSFSRMLAHQHPRQRESYKKRINPSPWPQRAHTVQAIGMDAHCRLLLLKTKEDKGTDPVPTWDDVFSQWRATVQEDSTTVDLVAVVDNRVLPGEWQRPVVGYVTVNDKTVIVKTTYGAPPRLAMMVDGRAWEILEARIRSLDCCAIGECGLDYNEPASTLPGQRLLFRQHIALAKELGKPLVLHLRGNDSSHPISAVLHEALSVLKANTSRQQNIHIHGFTGSQKDYYHWVGVFRNTLFGMSHKSVEAEGFGEVIRYVEMSRLVLETNSPHQSPHGLDRGHPYEVAVLARRVAEYRNVPSWVILKTAALNSKAFYQV